MSAVLEVRGLEKRFGGIVAVAGVSFDVNEGEILGIIGPNGSGKSTLFNCILGQLAPTAGDVRLNGRAVTGMRPCDLNRLGVSRTFQLLQIFPQLTVRENLILSGQEHRGTMLSRLVGPRAGDHLCALDPARPLAAGGVARRTRIDERQHRDEWKARHRRDRDAHAVRECRSLDRRKRIITRLSRCWSGRGGHAGTVDH